MFAIAGTWIYTLIWMGRDAVQRGIAFSNLLMIAALFVPAVVVAYLCFVTYFDYAARRDPRTDLQN